MLQSPCRVDVIPRLDSLVRQCRRFLTILHLSGIAGRRSFDAFGDERLYVSGGHTGHRMESVEQSGHVLLIIVYMR